MMYLGCACLVQDLNDRYLLVEEAKAVARGRMSLPGGTLEMDETLEQAAIREVHEETGLVVEIESLVGAFHCTRTSEESFGVNFIYAATVVGGELTTSPEHPVVDWFTATEIEAFFDQGQLRGAHAIQALRRFEAGTVLDRETIIQVPASH